MADIYIINSEAPKDIALEMQQIDSKNNYTVLKSKTANALVLEINEKEILNNFYNDYKPVKNFLYNKTFEPNKLSNEQINNLCLEYYENFIATNSKRLKNYPNPPKVTILENLDWWTTPDYSNSGYKLIFNNLMKKIDKELSISNYPIPPDIDPLRINKSFGGLINRNSNLGGIIHYNRDNYRIHKINFCGNKLSAENQKFWSWYQKLLMLLLFIILKSTILVM